MNIASIGQLISGRNPDCLLTPGFTGAILTLLIVHGFLTVIWFGDVVVYLAVNIVSLRHQSPTSRPNNYVCYRFIHTQGSQRTDDKSVRTAG